MLCGVTNVCYFSWSSFLLLIVSVSILLGGGAIAHKTAPQVAYSAEVILVKRITEKIILVKRIIKRVLLASFTVGQQNSRNNVFELCLLSRHNPPRHHRKQNRIHPDQT